MKMNRYVVSVAVTISAPSKKEAQRMMREIVESGSAMGTSGTKIAQVRLTSDPVVVDKLPF